MGFIIDDGTGVNGSAKVARQRLYVNSVTKTEEHEINEVSGKVWSIPFEGLNPTGADDYVLYIKNTGDNPIEISTIRVMADTAATQLELHAVSGTAAGGTSVTPISRTVGSASIPTATIESGSDITGLSDDGTIMFIQCDTVNVQYKVKIESKIRIPKGKAVGLLCETATANLTGVVTLFEEPV